MVGLQVNEEDFEVAGLFWADGKEESKVPGRFYSKSGNLAIQVFEDLRPDHIYTPAGTHDGEEIYEVGLDPDHDKPLLVHGIVGVSGKELTAVDCLVRGGSWTLGPTDSLPSDYELSPAYVIYGAHISGRSQEFKGARFSSAHLTSWLAKPGAQFFHNKDGFEGIVFKRSEPDSTQLAGGGRIAVRHKFGRTVKSGFGGLVSEKTVVQVDDLPSTTWRDLDSRYVTPVLTLITLCTGEENSLTKLELLTTEDEWVQVGADYIRFQEPENRIALRLAGYPDVGVEGLARWLEKVDNLGPLPPVVAHYSARRNLVRIETELLELSTVVEGLHARIMPDSFRLSDAEAEMVRNRMKDAWSEFDCNTKNVLRGMLQHLEEPGYRTRLRELFRRVESVAPSLCGHEGRWSSKVAEIRNRYAHRSAGFVEKGDIDELYTILLSLRWLLRIVLLLESGVDGSKLKKRLRSNVSYNDYLKEACETLPKIFPGHS